MSKREDPDKGKLKVGDVWTPAPSGGRVSAEDTTGTGWWKALKAMLTTTTAVSGFGAIIWATVHGPHILNSHALTSTDPANPYAQLSADMIGERKALQSMFGVRFRATYSAGTSQDYAQARPGSRNGSLFKQPFCVIRIPEPGRHATCSPSDVVDQIGSAMCVDPMWGLNLGRVQALHEDAEALFTLDHEEMHCLHDRVNERAAAGESDPPIRLALTDRLDAEAFNRLAAMGFVEQFDAESRMAKLDSETTADIYASLKALQSGRPDLVELVASQRWVRAVIAGDSIHMTAPLLDELMALHDSGALEEMSIKEFETEFVDLSSTQMVSLLISLRSAGLRYHGADMALLATGVLEGLTPDGAINAAAASDPPIENIPALGERLAEAIRRVDATARHQHIQPHIPFEIEPPQDIDRHDSFERFAEQRDMASLPGLTP